MKNRRFWIKKCGKHPGSGPFYDPGEEFECVHHSDLPLDSPFCDSALRLRSLQGETRHCAFVGCTTVLLLRSSLQQPDTAKTPTSTVSNHTKHLKTCVPLFENSWGMRFLGLREMLFGKSMLWSPDWFLKMFTSTNCQRKSHPMFFFRIWRGDSSTEMVNFWCAILGTLLNGIARMGLWWFVV